MRRAFLAACLLAAIGTWPVKAAERSSVFSVQNMTCVLCPLTVAKAMRGVEGVRHVTVDFEARTATVVYEDTLASPLSIEAASANAGYPAKSPFRKSS
jgi:mercuric ion binding protein